MKFIINSDSYTMFIIKILSVSTKGFKSIGYILERDINKSKLQKYTIFIDLNCTERTMETIEIF